MVLSPDGLADALCLRTTQVEVLTQGLAFVFSPEATASLEDRNDLLCEHFQLPRQNRRHDVEPVRGTAVDPILDSIGDLLWRAGHDEVTTGSGKLGEKLPHGQPLPPNRTDDQFSAPT